VKPKLVQVFLSVRPVTYRHSSSGPPRYRAEWLIRSITCPQLYKSKISSSKEDVIKLARAWLVRTNRPVMLMANGEGRTLYVDTTDQPERYGYSHESTERGK